MILIIHDEMSHGPMDQRTHRHPTSNDFHGPTQGFNMIFHRIENVVGYVCMSLHNGYKYMYIYNH